MTHLWGPSNIGTDVSGNFLPTSESKQVGLAANESGPLCLGV